MARVRRARLPPPSLALRTRAPGVGSCVVHEVLPTVTVAAPVRVRVGRAAASPPIATRGARCRKWRASRVRFPCSTARPLQWRASCFSVSLLYYYLLHTPPSTHTRGAHAPAPPSPGHTLSRLAETEVLRDHLGADRVVAEAGALEEGNGAGGEERLPLQLPKERTHELHPAVLAQECVRRRLDRWERGANAENDPAEANLSVALRRVTRRC